MTKVLFVLKTVGRSICSTLFGYCFGIAEVSALIIESNRLELFILNQCNSKEVQMTLIKQKKSKGLKTTCFGR